MSPSSCSKYFSRSSTVAGSFTRALLAFSNVRAHGTGRVRRLQRCHLAVTWTIVVAACGGSPTATPPATTTTLVRVSGEVGLSRTWNPGGTEGCSGIGADLKDVAGGLTVTIRNGSGVVVGVGRLGPGQQRPAGLGKFPDRVRGGCALPFSVGVPPAPIYQIELAGAKARGPWPVSFDERERFAIVLDD